MRARVSLLVVTLAVLAGCPPPVPEPAEPRAPALGTEELVERLVTRREALRSVRGRVEAELRFDEQQISTDMALLVERPDRLRAEALGLFGPVMLVALDGDRLTAFDAGRDLHLAGSYPEGAARAQLPIPPLEASELVNLLLGTPLDAARAASVRAEPTEVRSRVALHLRDDTGEGTLVAHDRLGVPLSFEWHGRRGGPSYLASWSWRDGDDLPRRVEIAFERGSAAFVVRWGEAERDPELADGLFRIPAPSGAELLDLDRARLPPGR